MSIGRTGLFTGFISHLWLSLGSPSDARLIHLKRYPGFPCPPGSLPATEGVNIDRHCLDRGGIETTLPCGHHAGTAIANCFDQGGFVGAIEPDLVGEIWRAEFLIALAGVAVTHRAVFREDFCAHGRIISRAGRQARQRSNVIGDRDDLILFQDPVLAEGEHLTFVGFAMSRAGTELDRLHDLVERATPQPIVVVQVGITLRTRTATAVAWRAIVA